MSAPPGQMPSSGAGPTQPNGERRSSFNFLRRQKSNEGGKMQKKQKGQSHYNQQANIPRVPPQLPTHSPLPKINSFGGDNAHPDSYQIATSPYKNRQSGPNAMPSPNQNHGVPMPPIPSSSPGGRNGDFVDPYARTESMTHRGRYSYASSAISTATGINSPRRVRRRKDPTPFK